MRLRIPESLTQQAHRLIREEILQGKMDRDQRLTEEFFAKRFRISKSPIREALNRLEAEGLVQIVPRRGAFVIDLTVEDAREIYQLREVLEACAIRNFQPEPRTFVRLRASLKAAEKHFRANDGANYVREDARFHALIAKAGGNLRLCRALEAMHHQMTILRHRTFQLSSRTSIEQHRRILQLLEKDERAGAERLMVAHIREVRNRLIKHLVEREAHMPAARAAAAL